ncbi:MAG: hypothetical protein PHF00_12400, partial [Elusimicrobia bacterium]|nr:hypothetical protein [Elusimicrobiota bacterium]
MSITPAGRLPAPSLATTDKLAAPTPIPESADDKTIGTPPIGLALDMDMRQMAKIHDDASRRLLLDGMFTGSDARQATLTVDNSGEAGLAISPGSYVERRGYQEQFNHIIRFARSLSYDRQTHVLLFRGQLTNTPELLSGVARHDGVEGSRQGLANALRRIDANRDAERNRMHAIRLKRAT